MASHFKALGVLLPRLARFLAPIRVWLSQLRIRSLLRRLDLSSLAALLVVLCANLTGCILYEVSAPPPAFEVPKIVLSKRPSDPVAIKEFVPPPLERFSAIDERPVFSPLRQPLNPPKGKDAIAQVRPPPSFILVGVIISGTERIAITRAPGANTAVTATLGQTIEDWEVTAIETDHITLRAGTDIYELPLHPPSTTRAITSAPVENIAVPQSPFAPASNR